MDKKWVEVNIRVPTREKMNVVLIRFVKPFVEKWKVQEQEEKRFISWHFLRETSPITNELEIRLRFYGPNKTIDDIKEDLDKELDKLELENQGVISHLFGAHGHPDDEYTGETDNFGNRGWYIFREFLMHSSETSLKFIEEEIIKGLEKPLHYYIERFFHLQINQLGPDSITKSLAIGPEISRNVFESLWMLKQSVEYSIVEKEE